MPADDLEGLVEEHIQEAEMREIKFRAWDIESNRMVYDPYFFERRLNGTGYRFYKDWRELEDSRSADCELMQFTGLTDKNGKEIYEGDIVDWAGDGGVVVFKTIELKPPSDDCYDTSCWAVEYDDIDFFGDACKAYLPLEDERNLVIGNIYENPELLEKQ